MSTVRIKHVVRNVVESSYGTPTPFLSLEDLESNTGRLLIDQLPLKSANDSILHQRHDVLFGKLRPYLAKSYFAECPGSSTSELLTLRASSTLDPRFLFYITLSYPWIRWADTTAFGSKMPRTSWELLGEQLFWLLILRSRIESSSFLTANCSSWTVLLACD